MIEKDAFVLIHEQNLQHLATEIDTVNNEISTPIMKDIFSVRESPYLQKCSSRFSRPLAETVYYNVKSISNTRTNLWDLVPNNLWDLVPKKKRCIIQRISNNSLYIET